MSQRDLCSLYIQLMINLSFYDTYISSFTWITYSLWKFIKVNVNAKKWKKKEKEIDRRLIYRIAARILLVTFNSRRSVRVIIPI